MGETETYDGPTVWRVVGWGDALAAEIGRAPGGRGLQRIVDVVDRVAGQPAYRGVRNSYARLTRSPGPPTDRTNSARAWLVLTALGCDPAEWLVGPDDLGPFLDRAKLAAALRSELWEGRDPSPPASMPT